MASAGATGAVVNTDLLPRYLPFLPSERGHVSLELLPDGPGSHQIWR